MNVAAPCFFDRITDRSNSVSNWVESYFYLKGISGKLGFRRFSLFCRAPGKVELKFPEKVKALDLLKTILKIISYVTLILPALFLMLKAIYRAQLKKIEVVGSPLLDSEKAQKDLEALWKSYKEEIRSHTKLNLRSSLDRVQDELKKDSQGTRCSPDDDLSAQPLLCFENDREALAAPQKVYQIGNDEEMRKMRHLLSMGFATGRSFIGVRLSCHNLPHTVAAVFHKDGRFKVIDSACDQSVDMEALTKQLNQAKILGKNGLPIKFKGEFVNTRIQRGGYTCIRFATLYLYQILKKRDLDAFEEVNGAFAEGQLNKFEDYTRMNPTKRLRNASLIPVQNYQAFMESWLYRCLGFPFNHWKEVTLENVVTMWRPRIKGEWQMDFVERGVAYELYILGPHSFDMVRLGDHQPIHLFIYNNLDQRPIAPLPMPSLQTTLGSLVPQQSDSYFIVLYEKGQAQPILFQLQPDDVLLRKREGHISQVFPKKSQTASSI